LVSVLDVLRDPRWGRSEECYSEDPYLSAELAKAAVKGIQDNGIIAVAKHFCAQGEGTGGINASAARIGERELREIHLPSAKACCQAGVKGIMAAYNEIDGIPCHTNKKLLTDILKDEMGFDGIVMADGLAIDQLDRMTGNNVLSGALALKAGVDVSLWDNGFAVLDKAHLQGLVTMEEIDRAVWRVLKAKFEQGLFENPYIEEKDTWTGYKVNNNPETLMLARESVVLLKNDENILPINPKSNKKIAVIGPNADAIYHQLGDYTPPIKKEDGITVLKGIKDVVQGKDVFEIRYLKGCETIEKENDQIKEAVELAGESDCVVLVLGGSSSRFQGADFDANGAAITSGKVNMDCGEGVDCADLGLPGLQTQLAEALFKTGKPIITVLIQGRPYAVNEISAYSKALLCAFYPGIVGGQAIAEILFGLISPSGRLPVSVPRHSGQLPVYYNYKNSYTAMNYYDNEKTSLYSFGYGLSYTKFSYSEISLSYWNSNQPRSFYDCKSLQKKLQRRFYGNRKINAKRIYFSISSDFLRHLRLQGAAALQKVKNFKLEELQHGCIKLQFSITNLGDYDSFAVPQLYIKDIQSSTIRRVKELKAFKKVWIPKGESRNCCLELNEEKLAIWNDSMQFLVEPGEIQLYLSDCGEDLWTSVITIDN
jgi:beta-glucosidase